MRDSPWLTNPYVIDEPIRTAEDFFGRESEIANLMTRIRRGTSSVILAPPRMGSTSLLNRLLQPDIWARLEDTLAGIELIDCADRIRHPLDFYRRLAQAIMLRQPELSLDTQTLDERLLADMVTTAIRRSARRWVFLLDNFEALAACPAEFFDHLRACANDGKPIFIIASHVPLDDLKLKTNGGSPFGNGIPVLRLGAWTPEDLDEFLTSTSRASGVDLMLHRDLIYRLGGLTPAFVQHVVAALFEMVAHDQVDETALRTQLMEALRDTFDQILNSPALRPGERDLLIAVVYGNAPAVTNGASAALSSLSRHGYLTPDGHIASELFADYLRASIARIFIDPGSRKVLVAGQPHNLPRRDFDLLLFLYANTSMVCSTEDILESVWGLPKDRQGPGDSTMVYQRIRALRQEVEENPKKPKHILNVPGTGYRFENYSQRG